MKKIVVFLLMLLAGCDGVSEPQYSRLPQPNRKTQYEDVDILFAMPLAEEKTPDRFWGENEEGDVCVIRGFWGVDGIGNFNPNALFYCWLDVISDTDLELSKELNYWKDGYVYCYNKGYAGQYEEGKSSNFIPFCFVGDKNVEHKFRLRFYKPSEGRYYTSKTITVETILDTLIVDYYDIPEDMVVAEREYKHIEDYIVLSVCD